MVREQFTDPAREGWWLVLPEPDPQLVTLRRNLGEVSGFSSETWYIEITNLETLYDWLAANQARLLDELDDGALAADVARQAKWISDVITAKAPAPAPAAPEAVPAAPEAGAGAEQAVVAAEPPAKKKGLFGKKDAPPAAEPAAEAGAALPADAPVEAAAEAAASSAAESAAAGAEAPEEPKRGGLFGRRAAAPGAAEAAAEPAAAAAAPAAADPAAEEAARAAAEVLEQANLPDEIKSDFESYIADPNVPVSAEEVAELIQQFPGDVEKQLEEAKQGLDQELESFLSDASASLEDEAFESLEFEEEEVSP